MCLTFIFVSMLVNTIIKKNSRIFIYNNKKQTLTWRQMKMITTMLKQYRRTNVMCHQPKVVDETLGRQEGIDEVGAEKTASQAACR